MDAVIASTANWPAASACLALGVIYTGYYLRYVVQKPILACGDPKLRRFLTTRIPLLSHSYWPTFSAYDTHLQTIIHTFFQFVTKNHTYRSEKLNTPDGGEIMLHWEDSRAGENHAAPIVVILPGLTGDSHSIYVKHMVDDTVKAGFRAVVFNQRGFGGAELKTPKTFCAGSTDDIHFVLGHIHQTYPDAQLMVAGASIGGIMLLNYLAEYGTDCVPLSGAMMVSVAWDLVESAKSLEQPVNSLLYNRTLTQMLINLVKTKGRRFKDHFDLSTVSKTRTLREFDSQVTVKLFGYRDVQHYYSSSSPKGKLQRITVPTLCLNAADDAFAPLYTVPLDEAGQSENVAIVVTARGGHVGFMEGFLPHSGKTYMSKLFLQYITAIFKDGREMLARD